MHGEILFSYKNKVILDKIMVLKTRKHKYSFYRGWNWLFTWYAWGHEARM